MMAIVIATPPPAVVVIVPIATAAIIAPIIAGPMAVAVTPVSLASITKWRIPIVGVGLVPIAVIALIMVAMMPVTGQRRRRGQSRCGGCQDKMPEHDMSPPLSAWKRASRFEVHAVLMCRTWQRVDCRHRHLS